MILELPDNFRAISFQYTTLDLDDENSSIWRILIEYRGPGDRWAVSNGFYCASRDGSWDHEPSPSNRTEEFRQTHRFTLKEAFELAPKALDKMVINSLKVKDGVLVDYQTEEPIRSI